MVSGVSSDEFCPNQTHSLSKSFVLDLVFNVSTKCNYHLFCNSVVSVEPVPVNVSFTPAHVCQPVNVVNSVFLHLHVETGRKLNVHKTFSLRPVSTRYMYFL